MAVKRGGLNMAKGLDSLIPKKVTSGGSGADKSDSNGGEKSGVVEKVVEKVVEVPAEKFLKVSEIVPDPDQPRKEFSEESLQELAESIREHGVIQPLLVQKKGKYYEIVAGERRWRAAKLAKMKKVPVVIREFSGQEKLEISLIENIQRENLNAIEEAKAYRRLLEEFGLTQEDVAKRVSKNRSTITNSLRLLQLDPMVQEMLLEKKLSAGHARAILALESPALQVEAAKQVTDRNLSVRDTEKLVKSLLNPRASAPVKTDSQEDIIFRSLEEQLKEAMGTKVSINRKRGNKGKIEIEYYSREELERIIDLLRNPWLQN